MHNTVVHRLKLANVIVTGFGERCNLLREGKMFVKDEENRDDSYFFISLIRTNRLRVFKMLEL